MYSIAVRSAAKRATVSAVGTSRTAAVAQVRFTSTMHENDPEVIRGYLFSRLSRDLTHDHPMFPGP